LQDRTPDFVREGTVRIFDARIHLMFDILFAIAFALGPLLLGLGGSPAIISFLLAVVFIVLAGTGWRRLRGAPGSVPIAHGVVELVLVVLLAFLPRIDGYSPGSPARQFYWTMAAALMVVWLLTAYRATRAVRIDEAAGGVPPARASRG
jgi:hypothetical protein